MSLPEGIEIFKHIVPKEYHWTEYFVFSAVLVFSTAIPIFDKMIYNKNLVKNLAHSFVSAVTLLGNPVEVYFYGQQYTMIVFAFVPMTILLSYFYVPVYLDLQLNSAYQIIYTPITVLGPCLAIDHVAGFDYRISSAAIFTVCIVNSAMGGRLSATLWTNTLQTTVMFTALFALAISSIIELGGLSSAWERSAASGRTKVFDMDFDPRTRHTFWTAIIGGTLLWLPIFGATQAQIQHYNYLTTISQSRQCLFSNMIGMMLVMLFCSFNGFLVYARYYECDPVTAKIITATDELLPYYVMDLFRNYPILPGLLVAGITCGSLTTVSSTISSLAVLLTEDFLKHYRPSLNSAELERSSRIISILCGVLGYGLVFLIKLINETMQISPFSTLVHGSLLGPILGAFSLGMFLPWTNTLGTLLGLLASVVITGFIGIGNIVAEKLYLLPDMKLSLSLRGCSCTNSTSIETIIMPCSDFISPQNLTQLDTFDSFDWKENDDSIFIKIWSTSYIWQPGIGVVSTLFFGAVFSIIVTSINRKHVKKVPARLLSKPFIKLWNKVIGDARMRQWIEYDNKNDDFPNFGFRNYPPTNGNANPAWISTKL
ncbi:Sodium-coupled monocarboxylate transporter 1 [Folsomia candida]|uniref:Sodium-coupled monocarboxylate transporter 1 n=2 Tax=Folsomia candida TaxID=158441 RepID=A0A226ELC7_FOLCA|nr:Sodium-coupled monocarboxylate transporter 1 [Folsomia candida]